MPPRRGREEMPPRRGPPQMPPRLPERPPVPPEPAPADAKAKGMFGGLFAKMGFGKAAEKKPAEPVPPAAEENRYDARGRNRYDDEEYDMPRRRFEEEEEEFSEEEVPRRPRKAKQTKKAKQAKKAKQLESLSSGEEIPSEPEPEEPEGKPQPFHRGKRIPYIPPLVKSTNPFARSCGNPFATVTTTPPKPSAPPAPGAAYDAYLPKKVEEKVRPTPRPGFNPFAAKQKGSLAVMTDWRNLPTPQPGFNPFQGERPKTIVINGKARTNPFA